MRNHSFFTLFTSLASLLIARSTLVAAFSIQNSPFAPSSATKMSTSANDAMTREFSHDRSKRRKILEREKKEWISRSVDYYSKVMREERRRNLGQVPETFDQPEYQEKYIILAKKHYFALKKIKTGNLHHAESIYRRIIDELMHEEEGTCDHSKLAVTTLLLALLMQRMGDRKATRAVFINFFRIAVLDNEDTECACSAKVLCAYALFEMKQNNRHKALELVRRAISFDSSLKPVLEWKQFREAATRSSWRRKSQQSSVQ